MTVQAFKIGSLGTVFFSVFVFLKDFQNSRPFEVCKAAVGIFSQSKCFRSRRTLSGVV